MKFLKFLFLACFIATPKGADLGVLFNSTNNNTVSPDNLVIATFAISTNLHIKYITPSRALSVNSSSNVVSSSLTDTQQGYLAALTGGTNLIDLGAARLMSGLGNPTNGIMETNRTLYINTASTTINDSLWVNLSTNWFRIASTNGGSINESQLNFSDVTTANSSTNFHGLLKKLSGNTTQFMRGDGNWALPSNNLSNSLSGTRYLGTFDPDPSQQGYTFYNTNFNYTAANGGTLDVPNINLFASGEIIGDATTDILIGSGAVIGSWDVSGYTDTTIGNVSTSAHGLAPKGDGNSAHFLNGIGGYSTPAGGGAGTITSTGSPIANQITYWSGTNSITGDSTLRFVLGVLVVPTINPTAYVVPATSSSSQLTYGTYTPTRTPVVNSTTIGTSDQIQHYTRVGNEVTVTGRLLMARTGSGNMTFRVSLPVVPTGIITPTITGLAGNGIAVDSAGTFEVGGVIIYNDGNNPANAEFKTVGSSTSGTIREFWYSFIYTTN